MSQCLTYNNKNNNNKYYNIIIMLYVVVGSVVMRLFIRYIYTKRQTLFLSSLR